MPPVEVLLDSASPLVTILLITTESQKAATAMTSGLAFLNLSGTIGILSSVSRLTWAWARDGGKNAVSIAHGLLVTISASFLIFLFSNHTNSAQCK